MQIEDYIVQNYRENCWICHQNSLGKKQFFLAEAETVVAGKQWSLDSTNVHSVWFTTYQTTDL